MKKILGLIVVLVTSVLLVACGDKNVSEDLKEIKIYGNFDTFNPSEDYVGDLIEELTGVRAKYDFLPQDPATADTKLYLDIAGRSQYHLLKLSSNQFNQLRSVNALLDIKPLLEKYGQNILKSVDQNIWNTSTFDGGVYAVPQKNPTDNINMALFLRKDIFTKHGLELPETLTEFKDVLIALKEKEGANFVPFSASSHLIDPIRGAFGIVKDWVEQPDGSVKFWAETKEFNDYANYINELVKAGVMQEGYLTTPNYGSSSRPGLQNGTVAVTLDAWWSGNGIINGIASSTGKTQEEIIANAGDYLHFIPSLKGDENYGINGKGEAKMDYSISYFFAIPQYMSKYAEAVIKWMDKKLEPEIFKQLTIGVEGVHHEYVNGEYLPILSKEGSDEVPFDLFAKADYYLTGTNTDDYSEYWKARARKNPRQQFVWEQMNLESYKKEFGVLDKLGLAPGFSIYGANVAKMKQMSDNFLIANISGQGDKITQEQLIANLIKDAKLKESTTEVNEWYKKN